MHKIFILGESGSGKSTLARNLSKRKNIPLFNLDEVFWDNENYRPFSHERTEEEIRERVAKILSENDNWIIEGVYSQDWVLPIFEQATHIYYLNVNILIRDWRIIKRDIKDRIRKGWRKSGSIISLIKLLQFMHQNRKARFLRVQDKLKRAKKKCRMLPK